MRTVLCHYQQNDAGFELIWLYGNTVFTIVFFLKKHTTKLDFSHGTFLNNFYLDILVSVVLSCIRTYDKQYNALFSNNRTSLNSIRFWIFCFALYMYMCYVWGVFFLHLFCICIDKILWQYIWNTLFWVAIKTVYVIPNIDTM